ncbi:MAG: diguanylate cyclase [Roseburia sp.]|nr:diguanylate cyclase [Anaeroplasma bactoclasticum]MCM1195648.1 diguanylate cyclase [Roseburia sp.]MCM1556608.1 diguanylate cyclase [Anaeroplasma bactoclasticum]
MNKIDNKLEHTILIADDSEMNRSLLADMLGNEYKIIEAEDGTQVLAHLQNEGVKVDLVLLDIVMPNMDGFEVLAYMNRNGWIKDIPVIVISSETSPSCMERAYELGVTDFINRPFDVWIVRRRVMNTLMLASKQKMLVGMVTDQIYKREKMSNLMITILSHIVEFRNGESGMHVLHIRTISEILLKNLVIKTNQYGLSQADISLIGTASALHDIGKIAIPDKILNKPGKLTKEEYEIMKKHSEYGALMLDDLNFLQDEKLVQYARQICRWHHERYDGKGYPDGLKGDEIPISAQVVALADVYDALTSSRVYKTAYSHDKAMQMILNGECGVFNPLLIECLLEAEETLIEEVKINSFSRDTYDKMNHITDEILQDDALSPSARTLILLENERTKTRFFAELSQELQFEYVMETSLLMIYDFGKKKLGLDELIMNPLQNEKIMKVFGEESLKQFVDLVEKTTPKNYAFSMETLAQFGEESRWVCVSGRSLFKGEPAVRTSIIGKIIDINTEHKVLKDLQHKATHDSLTLLYNAGTAKEKITECLNENKDYVLLILDLDYLKTMNDTYGHNFGNQVLQHISSKLKSTSRGNDIIARIGGDEFLVFFEEHKTQDATIQCIFNALTEPFNDLHLSVSVGVATTKECGKEYDYLFNCADKALYKAKNDGKHCIRYYDKSLIVNSSTMTSIDDIDTENGSFITLHSPEELKEFLKNIHSVYERTRIYNVETAKCYHIDEDGNLLDITKNDTYINAGRISTYGRALMTRGKASEVAYRGNNLYYINAIYLECGIIPYVLEIITPLRDDTIIDNHFTKARMIFDIDSQGEKKYKDPIFNIYNKVFYEEQLKDTAGRYSLANIEVHMKNNELEKVISTLKSHIRSTDMVIRYEENEFLIILEKIQEKHFKLIIEEIYKDISKFCKVYIGACQTLGRIESLALLANKNLNLAKTSSIGFVYKNVSKE